MKKIIVVGTGILAGVLLAITVHCNFMIVTAGSGYMLPAIEPGQKVIVWLMADKDEIKAGDVVAYKRPYYVVEGENGIILRRVATVTDDGFILVCDADLASQQGETAFKEDIIGKALIF